MRRLLPGLAVLFGVLFVLTSNACAVEVRISAQALERTLKTQLFSGPEGRYYLRGDMKSFCFVYVDNPHVSFKDDRVVVQVHTRAKLGTSVYGRCVGVGLNTDTEVSIIPDAQGETIGFRDARIEKLTDSRELNFVLTPFLSGQVPQQLKVNAADLMRQVLSQSKNATGYLFQLDSLKIHSMMVQGKMLVLDVDGTMSVN